MVTDPRKMTAVYYVLSYYVMVGTHIENTCSQTKQIVSLLPPFCNQCQPLPSAESLKPIDQLQWGLANDVYNQSEIRKVTLTSNPFCLITYVTRYHKMSIK